MQHDIEQTARGREPRMPLFVRVLTEPALPNCWTVNITSSGLGLVAQRAPTGAVPDEGDRVEMTFALPDNLSNLRTSGIVMWRHDSTDAGDRDGHVALGVAFTDLSSSARLALSRYLHGYRFRVCVAFASPAEQRALSELLEDEHELHFADSHHAVQSILRRGDIAALVLAGDDEELARQTAQQAIGMRAAGEWEQGVDPADRGPRVIFCSDTSPEHLLPLFNAGIVFRALTPPVASSEVASAVRVACKDHGVRTEQRRVGLALERALLRERAKGRDDAVLSRLVSDKLVFQSKELNEVLSQIRLVAPHKMVVLLQGETGTGKEMLARLLHELSERAHAPFVVQDCGVLTETLLESELFGHAKGAFTGAAGEHPGLFQIADGGTVFLDEIENTSPAMQAKLLRVIETGEIRPVGDARVRKVDVRIVAATNKVLPELVSAGLFRSDLFYRLSNFPVRVPPLRERRDDILPLVRHFLVLANQSLGRDVRTVSQPAESSLVAHDWPGNIRELRNVIERAVLMCRDSRVLDAHHLPEELRRGARGAAREECSLDFRERIKELEKELIAEALTLSKGVLRDAAKRLGLNEITLGRKAKLYGLR